MQTESHGRGAVVFRMDGVFDLPAAQRLSRLLEQTADGDEVRIDLTHVREFHDYGVTVLARALAARGERVAVRGLRQHHLRLLRYLGVETGAADLGRPEEAV
jgi:hypothetical protein